MKNYKNFLSSAIMIVAIFFALTSCVKDWLAGPTGVNGINGLNGIDGKNGKNANSACITCHTIANFDAKVNEHHL